MIICNNVSFGYLTGQEVLRDISFEIARSSFHFISGASGAGKSSLLKLLSLTLRASRGEVTMFGHKISELPREELATARRKIGMVYQDFRLINHLTVEENVALPLKIAGESKENITAKVDELLHWVGLDEYKKVKPEILSGGQKQRVAIARAVVGKPDLLLADEPSGNLDPALSLKFMYLFEALNKAGTTVLIATHAENLISMFPYPVLRLRDGRLVRETVV